MNKIKLYIYDLCLDYCKRVGQVLKEDRDTITLVQREGNGSRYIPNPKNPKKMMVRGANGRFTKAV